MTDSDLLDTVTGPVHTVDYETNRDVKTQVENTATVGTRSVVSLYAYQYDAIGRREDRDQSGTAFSASSTDTFAYNDRSEVIGSVNDVTSAFAFAYTYDAIGNRKTSSADSDARSYTSNVLNQYTAITDPSVSPLYDEDGNMTFDGTWTYSWNGENRLASATDGSTTITYVYDYMGRLVERDGGTDTVCYIYDGWNRIATLQVGSVTATNLWGLDLSLTLQGAGGVGGLLKEGSLYPFYDANGNIGQKLDVSGNAVMAVEYDPFGNIISGTLTGEYGFSTKPLDAETGLYYYGFRWYDPTLGRWPSRDPLEEYAGLNLYAMVGNDAVNDADKIGLISCLDVLKNAGVNLADPGVNCFNEGWYRHCVNSCVMGKCMSMFNPILSFITTNFLAMWAGGDFPWQHGADFDDIKANNRGWLESFWGVFGNCEEGCKDAYDRKLKSECCDSNLKLKKNDPKCCD